MWLLNSRILWVFFFAATLFVSLFVPHFAEARVFDFKRENLAAFVSFGASASSMGTNALKDETSLPLSYSGNVKNNYSGEFGFAYSLLAINFKFGIEIIKPTNLANSRAETGTDQLYTAESEIMGFVPKVAMDIRLSGDSTSRSYLSLGVGDATLTMKNAYTLTAVGQAAFPGVTDHKLEAKGSGLLYNAGLGYENHMSDTTTLVVELGYRHLVVDKLKYSEAANTFSGAVESGDVILNSQGDPRKLNLSGAYISLGFRFYL